MHPAHHTCWCEWQGIKHADITSPYDGVPQVKISQCMNICLMFQSPQWGAVDTEIKVPSGENTELKGFPFKAWSRSVYRYTCYAYCQGFLLCLFLPFQSIHLHFFQNLSQFFPALAVANSGSCVGPQNKIGHPAGCRFPWNINRIKKKKTCGVMTCEMNDLGIQWSFCSALM